MDTQTEMPSSSKRDSTCSATNWELCCLCQCKTGERLVDPTGVGCVTLATNIPEFYNMNCMPIRFDPKRLHDGEGILLTLERNKATYHESCKLKFKTSKLERKRKSMSTAEEQCGASSAKFTRSSLKKTGTEKEEDPEKLAECFICDQQAKVKDL